MYSMNRIGQNRPLCNNRQFVTMGIINHQPEEMNLKPEYLGNEHFKFLNNFGCLQQKFISDKKFLDINNSVSRHPCNNRMALNPSQIVHNVPSSVMLNCTANYHTSARHNICKGATEKPFICSNFEKPPCSISKIDDTNNISMVASKHEKVDGCRKSPPRSCEESQGCSNMNQPKKSKRNTKTQCDKANQKSKKTRRQKSYQKQSKRECDRNIIGNSMSSRKRKNGKPWHKESLEKEIMEMDDVDVCFCSHSDHSLESPVITSVYSTTSLPIIQSVCTQNIYNNLSSPTKVVSESTIQNNKHSPTGCDLREQDINMGHSPKQNNFRPRLPSECESEDSFIVFEEGSKSIDLDDDLESSDYDFSSDEDSDDSDVMDFCTITQNQNNCGPKTSSPTKKVRFAIGKDMCEVHPMVQWSFAYQKARKGPWEQFALDRMRFKNRISAVESVLDDVLQPAHRRKVYRERFLQDEN